MPMPGTVYVPWYGCDGNTRAESLPLVGMDPPHHPFAPGDLKSAEAVSAG